MLINAPAEWREGITTRWRAGRRRAAAGGVIEGMGKIGFDITHVYGLTETYGPAAVCAKHEEWPGRPAARRAGPLNGRQGVRYRCRKA
jgi:fatty-acyl-CoA synthase